MNTWQRVIRHNAKFTDGETLFGFSTKLPRTCARLKITYSLTIFFLSCKNLNCYPFIVM